MFPNLSDLVNYFFHTQLILPFPTFGFFMFLSFMVAYYVFQAELKRKESLGILHKQKFTQIVGEPAGPWEILLNGVFGFFIGFKIPFIIFHYVEFASDPPKFIGSWNGNWWFGLIIALVFGFWAYYEKNKDKLPEPKREEYELWPHELMGNTALYAAGFGIIGAKLFDNLEHWDSFIRDPIGNTFSTSGLTFYGGLIFGGIAVLWYMNKNGVKPLTMLDIGAPGMMIAYSVGRIGCQLSGDGDWGIPNLNPKPGILSWLPDWVWSFNFPNNVENEDPETFIPGCIGQHCHFLKQGVYPTSFYETIICFLLFLVIWSLRKRIKIPGILFCIYLVLNGTERFLIELIRVNSKYHLWGLAFTQAELIALTLILVGFLGSIWIFKNPNTAQKSNKN